MSLIFATQLAAAATAVLAVFAIVTAYYARKAFLKQSQEVSDQADMLRVQSEQLDEQRKLNAEQTKVLELQAKELHASLAQRHSAQASMVFIRTEVGPDPRIGQVQRAASGPGADTITAYVENASDRPIYSPELLWDDGSASLSEVAVRSRTERLRVVLMPGKDDSRTRDHGPDTRAVMLRFRDAAGNSWLRGPEGDLVDIAPLAGSDDPGS